MSGNSGKDGKGGKGGKGGKKAKSGNDKREKSTKPKQSVAAPARTTPAPNIAGPSTAPARTTPAPNIAGPSTAPARTTPAPNIAGPSTAPARTTPAPNIAGPSTAPARTTPAPNIAGPSTAPARTNAWGPKSTVSSDKSSGSKGPHGRPEETTTTTFDCRPLNAALHDSLNSSNQSSVQQQGDPKSSTASDQRGAYRNSHVIHDIVRTRPENLKSKRGTDGIKVSLTANYYKILKAPTWQLYQYHVDFSPSDINEGFKIRLIKDQRSKLGGYLFNGKMLFLTEKLRNETTEIITKDKDNKPIQIKIKFTGLVSMTTAASIQVLNLILRRLMGVSRLQFIPRNFFDPDAAVDLRAHKLKILPGYQTSIRQHEADILICVDVTSKVMQTETIYDILIECYRNCQQQKGSDYRVEFQAIVVGMIVITEYNHKTYRIDDVDFKNTPSSTFVMKDKGEITFTQYYKDKHGLVIKDQGQPLLIQKPSAREIRDGRNPNDFIALIPELCRTTGLSDQQRKNFGLMNDVAKCTRLSPGPRIERLRMFNQRLQNAESEDANSKDANSKDANKRVNKLRDWNLKLDKDLVQVVGRVLPPETIQFGNKEVKNSADWSREFRYTQMHSSVHLQNWYVIVPRQCEREWNDFYKILYQAASSIQYNIRDPRVVLLSNDDIQTLRTELENAANHNPQLIMCILRYQDSSRYGVIKKKCCVERAIPTQVLVANTIRPKRDKPLSSLLSIATKVVIQINSKLGGVPWMVTMPLTNLMVIGFDVCHDTNDDNKSYGAMVATMNSHRRFFSTVSTHGNHQELSNEFPLNITKALTEYNRYHRCLPSHILIYRDGVGEGDTGYVLEHEVSNIRKMLDNIYGDNPCKMAFIIVSKRINTRFFNGKENPSPGTVVDDVVTLPERYDFFLVSQSVRNGTVSPTNYNVIYDTLGVGPNRLQILTYKMTHLYYNWSGTLSVPAVCQYAHKLAYLVGNFIHQRPSNMLEKQLYFL